jgi:hypothetical protein
MSEYVWLVVHVVLGLIGGAFHWIKKRYIDDTTLVNFIQYLRGDFTYTKRATYAIICAEVALSMTHIGGTLTLSELLGALTAGYMADSTLNRTE